MGNTKLEALIAGAQGHTEPDENVTPLPTKVGPRTFVARLRGGYYIQVGADPNDPDSFIQGPADVPLTPKLAMAHMAKWENPNVVKEWLAANYPRLVDGKPWFRPRSGQRRLPSDVPRADAMKLADRTLAAQLAAAEAEVQRLKGLSARAK